MIDSLRSAPFQSQKQERLPGPQTQEGEHANMGNHTHTDFTPAKIASSIQIAVASSNNYFAKCQLESSWRELASQLLLQESSRLSSRAWVCAGVR